MKKVLIILVSTLLATCSKENNESAEVYSSNSTLDIFSPTITILSQTSTNSSTSDSSTSDSSASDSSTSDSSASDSSTSDSSTSDSSESYTISVTAQNLSNYILTGTDLTGSINGNDPNITINSGDSIIFNVNANGHPFLLIKDSNAGFGNDNLVEGVTNNGVDIGTISWTSLESGTYYYVCEYHSSMFGVITVN